LDDNSAWRDTLVITLRADGFLDEPQVQPAAA
jgi:hypothetical protein